MKKLLKHFLILFLFCVSINFGQSAADKIKFSGAFFGDYFYNFNHIDPAKVDVNGVQFRRIFFTADMFLSERFDSRLRFEGNQDSEPVSKGEKIGWYIKDASLRWKNIFEGSDFIFGLSPTPAWMITQEVWYYRSVEKTPMDLFGISLSRDLGIDLKGKIISDGTLNYWIKLGNNSGQSIETNKYKRFYALIQYKPNSNFMATLFADYAAYSNVLDPYDGQSKSNDRFVSSLFVNYKNKRDYSFGGETFFVKQLNNLSMGTGNPLKTQNGFGFSFWGWYSLNPKLKLIARFDKYNPATELDNQAISFFVSGIDFVVDPSVSIIPNVEYFKYQNHSGNNLIARLTFSYRFNELILID